MTAHITAPTSPKLPAGQSLAGASCCASWVAGDVARVPNLTKHPRVMILEISDRAYCVNEHGHRVSWDANQLLTLDAWIEEARLIGQENGQTENEIAAYITAGAGDVDWHNAPVMPRSTTPTP
jgi:hypothetical protein